MMEGAASLIYFDTSDKLRLNQDGLRALKKIPDDYGIVSTSMLGHGRIGKSSLLNQLAEKNVFEVGSMTTRVTKGIWIYVRLDHTCKRAYMYCDVEGFGDPKTENCHSKDKRLLVMICQICDIVVFNFKGVYDSDLLHRLTSTCASFKKYRNKHHVLSNPGLVVVLRDYNVDPPESADDELKQLFRDKPSFPTSFRSVKAFQLVIPTERKQLQNLNSLPDSEFDSEFVQERSRLQAYLKSEAKPLCTKTGDFIGGEVLSELIKETIKDINSGNFGSSTQTLPDIIRIRQNNQRFKEEALRSYECELTRIWPSTSEPETIQTSLQTLKKKIIEDLKVKLVDFDGSVFKILQDFEVKTQTISDRLSKEKSEKELARLRSFETNLRRTAYIHQEFPSEKRTIETKYQMLNNLGPMAESVWKTYEYELKEEEIKQNKEMDARLKAQKAEMARKQYELQYELQIIEEDDLTGQKDDSSFKKVKEDHIDKLIEVAENTFDIKDSRFKKRKNCRNSNKKRKGHDWW